MIGSYIFFKQNLAKNRENGVFVHKSLKMLPTGVFEIIGSALFASLPRGPISENTRCMLLISLANKALNWFNLPNA